MYIIDQSDCTLQKSTGLLFPASQGRESEMEDDDIEYDITFPSPTGPEEDIEDEYVIEGEVKEPVVILLGWAGCQEKHLQKYCQIYEERSVQLNLKSVVTTRSSLAWELLIWSTTLHTTCFLWVISCVMWVLWIVPISRNGAQRQWFIVATISSNFFLLKSLLAGTTAVMHRYGPNDTYPCVFNMKRTT